MNRSTRLGLVLVAASCRATTLATVGDSFADSFYFGLRARPDLLKKNQIELIRWSRPSVGLVRSDQFDYAGWLRDATDLGTADYCVVQVGTNDMQSIPAGAGKWVLFPTEAWQNAYSERVQEMTEMLRERRCRRLIWALQPGFERSRFLSKNRDLINKLQAKGVELGGVVVEVAAEAGDYGRDGIHFNGPFALKLADDTLAIVTAWRDRAPESCFACHRSLPADRVRVSDVAALRPRPGAVLMPGATLLAGGAAHSVTPPRVVVRAAHRSPARRRRRHA